MTLSQTTSKTKPSMNKSNFKNDWTVLSVSVLQIIGSEQRRNVTEQFIMADIFVHKNQQIDLELSEVYQYWRSQRCYFSLYLLHTTFFKTYLIFDTEISEKGGIFPKKYSISHTKPRRNYWMNSNELEFWWLFALYILDPYCSCIQWWHY